MLVNRGSGAGWKKSNPSYEQNDKMMHSQGLVFTLAFGFFFVFFKSDNWRVSHEKTF
jgi:heme/copper-type cytochrome/quinol oxidase subunit 3